MRLLVGIDERKELLEASINERPSVRTSLRAFGEDVLCGEEKREALKPWVVGEHVGWIGARRVMSGRGGIVISGSGGRGGGVCRCCGRGCWDYWCC